MFDLHIGLVIMAILTVGFYAFAYRLTRGRRRLGTILAIVTVLVLPFYIRSVWDDARLALILPFSNMIILGNWFPLMTGFLAGLAWNLLGGGPLRKIWVPVALFSVGGYTAAHPLLGQAPACRNEWSQWAREIDDDVVTAVRDRVPTPDVVCHQTHSATCSAACAATLLKWHGIEANEQEMVRLCLTSDGERWWGPVKGTRWRGLYHGLKCKTAGTPWTVKIIHGQPSDLLAQIPGPIILAVGLKTDGDYKLEDLDFYQHEWGWHPGELHSLILIDRNESGHLEMIDPDPRVGPLEPWSDRDVSVLWRGIGMRLVPRDPGPARPADRP